MLRKLSFVFIGLLLCMGTACSSSSTAGTSTPSSASSPTPQSPSPQASGTPVSYDPCVLLNAGDATTLTGVTFGAPEDQLFNATKECIYGAQTRNVLSLGIVQAPDQATVTTDEAEAKAALQQSAGKGLAFTEVQGVGDAAAEVQTSVSANGTTIALCGIYVVKGLIFFFVTDVAVNHPVPSNAALQTQAANVLGRL